MKKVLDYKWISMPISFGLIALFYFIATYFLQNPRLALIIKPFPVWTSAIVIFFFYPKYKSLGLGLIFAGLGDLLIEFDFVIGLLCFLGTHIVFIIYFSSFYKYSVRGLILSVLMTLIAVWYIGNLFPYVSELLIKIGVFVYIPTILLMFIFASFQNRSCYWTFVLGALLFIFSDSMIAWNAFRSPIPNADLWIMLTYYAAQMLIISSVFFPSKDSKEACLEPFSTGVNL